MTAVPFVRTSIGVAVVVAVFTATGVTLPFQPLVAAAFFLWVPGAAAIGLAPIEDRLLASVLAVATSLAVGTLVAVAMVWLHAWYPAAVIVALCAACVVGLHHQLTHPPLAASSVPSERTT